MPPEILNIGLPPNDAISDFSRSASSVRWKQRPRPPSLEGTVGYAGNLRPESLHACHTTTASNWTPRRDIKSPHASRSYLPCTRPLTCDNAMAATEAPGHSHSASTRCLNSALCRRRTRLPCAMVSTCLIGGHHRSCVRSRPQDDLAGRIPLTPDGLSPFARGLVKLAAASPCPARRTGQRRR